ncbi:MAG: glycosyltransferase family 39 protein [Thermoanaerobaculia bacterium]
MTTLSAEHDLDATQQDDLSQRTVWILLGLLLVWSFGLRLWDASVGLNMGRFWDERYGLYNIDSLLRGGGLRPVNGFHPSLSYLPQAAVLWLSEQLHELTGNPIFEVFARRGFTSTTYLLCRLTQVVMGCLSLFMTFVIGRRLAGSRVGLLAAFLLSIVPWHIRQSVIYKPDILLLLTTLIAFYLSMRAVGRPSLGSYLAAGAAIGLALSSKFNAGPIAIPLTVAALWMARQDRRHLLWLVSAGATSVVVFLALNPYVLLEPDIYRRSFAKTLRDYERKGEVRGGDSHLNQVVYCVESLLSKEFHGKVLGSLGLVGMVAATINVLKKHRGSLQSLYWVMLVSYVVGYVAIYALTTANPSAHNWLTLTPFVALSAAWVLVEIWRLAAGRVQVLARPWVARAAVAVYVVLLASTANSYVYRVAVPPTANLAGRKFVSSVDDVEGRLVYSEVRIRRVAVREGRETRAVVRRGPLDQVTAAELDTADAEIFAQSWMEDEEVGEFYRQRLERVPPDWVTMIDPSPFRARGPALVLVTHPLEREGELEDGHWVLQGVAPPTYGLRSPKTQSVDRLVSLDFSLPSHNGARAEARIVTDQADFRTIPYRVGKHRSFHTTPRLPFGSETTLVLDVPADYVAPEEIPFELRRWRGQQ